MNQEDFYQKQYFDALSKQISDLQTDVSDIKSRVFYMYGFAAGVGFFASLAFEWIKSKFFN